MSKWLYGLHDEGGEHLMADKPGWIVISEAIGSDPNDGSGRDYRHLADRGFTVIARLNNAHNGKDGTIPMQGLYANFAKRCANFVKASRGCTHFIIANEPQHLQERPNGQAVTPMMYAECFNRCYDSIKAVAPQVQVITAPIAPWDATTQTHVNPNGDWVDYFAAMLSYIKAADGIGLHTYTHGAGIHLITSSARMQPPFQHRRYEFRAYLDFLEAVPADKAHLPVYVTETDQVEPWVDANTQWVLAAYAEIDAHNQRQGTQKIHCLVLYRWQGDQWHIEGKNGVHADFRAAVGRGYLSPTGNIDAMPETTLLPYVPNESPPAAPLLPVEWDERLTARGVAIKRPPAALHPGDLYWRVVRARWFSEAEAGGRHHIYVEAPSGTPFRVEWPSGSEPGATNGRTGFDAGNYPMSGSLNEFSVRIEDRVPSETVTGIGMGADGNKNIHTATLVTFELVTVPQAQPQPSPQPQQPATVPALAHPVADLRYRNVTQPFGVNGDYYSRFKVDGVPLRGHNGIDFGTLIGSEIVAVDEGRVVEVADEGNQGYGRYIKLVHPWGESLYAHLTQQFVTVGAVVLRGQRLGLSGNTGNSTGPHLHFGLRVSPFDRRDGWGGYTDPAAYLLNTPPAPTPRPTIDVLAAIKAAAHEFDLDWRLLASQAWAESSWRPDAVSDVGARGIMQIVPATWAEWSAKIGAGNDPYIVQQNARVGAAYLKWLLAQTNGNTYTALQAYVWGIGNVLSGADVPDEVIAYSAKVVHGRDLLKAVGA